MFSVQHHEPKPLTWWYSRRDDIDFDPVYQRRGGIWARKAKAYLIDSILNGYDIPKLYVADFTLADSPLNEKKKMYAIIDGKQRLEAVFDFFEDKLPLGDDFVYEQDRALDVKGLRYSELRSAHPRLSRIYDEYELDVMSVVTDEKGKIEELFVRFNRYSQSLSGAETRNAMPGIVPVLTRELADHPFFLSKIRFSVLRYEERHAATKLLLIEYKQALTSVKRTDLDAFTDGIKAEEGPETQPYRQAAARVRRTLNMMATVFVDRDDLLTAAGIIPVYYWLVRNHSRQHRTLIRPFLQEFVTLLRDVNRQAKAGATGLDQELLRYSTSRRNPMDAGALTELYNVLERRFGAWQRRGGRR